jgi:hypothetical protein
MTYYNKVNSKEKYINNDLEALLNEIHDQPEEKEYRKYEECVKCNRRIFIELFQGHTTCCHCRGVNALGVPVKEDNLGEYNGI